jgi:uncharacterized membrane protein
LSDDSTIIGPLSYPGIRRGLVLIVALIVAHGAFGLIAFFHLPATIPIHFDADGAADGFTAATLGGWMFLWLVSAALGVLAGAGALWVFRAPPRYLSLPRQRAFAALPEVRRARAMSVLSLHVIAIGSLAMATLLAIHVALALAAHELIARFPSWIVWVAVVAVIAEIAAAMSHVSRTVTRQIDEHTRGPTA